MATWTVEKREVTSEIGPGNGIVAAQHFEAAEAGAAVLARGGNAMDAAVVTVLCLSVLEPWLSGIGGGGLLVWAGNNGNVDTLDFNVRASRNAKASDYPLTGGNDENWFGWPAVQEDRNIIGPLSIAVPGTIAGLNAALDKYGTLSWADALAPAIEFAERGMIVDWFACLAFAIDIEGLNRHPVSSTLYAPGGKPRQATSASGYDYLPMPAKARTLKRLAEAGARDFYEGEVAASLVADFEAVGCPIDALDLAGVSPRWASPQSRYYRGRDVHVVPGLTGGPSLLEALERLETRLPGDVLSAAAGAAYASAIRETYEHRLQTMGHAAGSGDCTSHVSVVDGAGNMVSLTNTLLSRFGSKVTLPNTGILMNNGMNWFDPRPGVPNRIAPAAKPLANMSPVIVTRDGKPFLALGAAGGRQIFPALLQLMTYVIDGEMSLEAAQQAPRLDGSGPTVVINQAAVSDLPALVAETYPVRLVENTLQPVHFAIPSMVMADGGRLTGMSHPISPWAAAVTAKSGEDV